MKPLTMAILTALVWGCVPIIEKLGLAKLPVAVGLFYRCIGVVLGALVLLVFQFSGIRAAFSQSPQSWLYLMTGGILASFIGQFLFYFSLKNGEASKVVPIAAAYPVVSFILGVIFLREKVTLAKTAGMAFVLVGIVLLK